MAGERIRCVCGHRVAAHLHGTCSGYECVCNGFVQLHEHDPGRDQGPAPTKDGTWIAFRFCTCGAGFGVFGGAPSAQAAADSVAESLRKHCEGTAT